MTIAALILPFALMQAAQGAQAASPEDQQAADRFQHCVSLIEHAPEQAYEDGMAWASQTQSVQGYRCAAMALIAEHRYEEGARRLQSLANALNPEYTGYKAELLSQAGNAWLLARNAQQARSALTRAITIVQGDRLQLPDLLIDRARAFALARDYRHAEEDLSQALDIRPHDGLALALRAESRMRQNSFDLAEVDINAAIATDPTNVDYLKTRGDIIESRRTGAPVSEQ
jgi:tetratricopeptide (TPR) repeat protein